MKRSGLCALIISLVSFNATLAQLYGDEWIDYNQEYFRIGLAEDGIYRLSFSDLSNAGFPVSTVDPRRIQLFYKGVEQAILVSGQGDAVFNTSDFIEFYGKRNDGEADSRLYQPASAQPHQFYSIYSDSSSYFLTYNLTTADTKRMESFDQNNADGLPALTSHEEQILNLNVSNYSLGQGFSSEDFTKFTYFDFGEGWTSPFIQENESADFIIEGINNQVESDGVPRLEVLFVGRDDVDHDVSISVGQTTSSLRTVGTQLFSDYEASLFTTNLLWSDVSASGSITVRITDVGVAGDNDKISTSYIRVSYPQEYDMGTVESKPFFLSAQPVNKSYIEIANTPSQTQLYDITDTDNVIRIGSNVISGGISAIINTTLSDRKLFANGPVFMTPNVQKVSFREINAPLHDYIIISNKFLMAPSSGSSNPIKTYGGYRASIEGGDYDTLVVDIDMLYNQFNYGVKNPLAVYDFMRFMVDNGAPKFLFIIGKGLEPDVNFHRNPNGVIDITQSGVNYQIRDLVPTAGAPGSDILFTAGLDGTTYEPAVPVGRLPARNSTHVMAYLNKVRETESKPFDELTRKRVLHLSGGISQFELINFRSFMDGFKAVAEDDFFGGNVETIAKTSGSTVELINVADEVNQGLNLITFFGHSAPDITDIDIGFVTDPLLGYNNAGRYPSFLINGCNAGQFFQDKVIFGEDWVLAQDKGALGFIAHSSFGFTTNLKRYSDLFYQFGYGDSVFVSKTISEVQMQVAKHYMEISSASANNITQVQQMVLLGDPAIKLFGPETPDFEIVDNDIIIESFNEDPVTALSDSFAVKLIVRNYGRTISDSLLVNVTRTLSDNTIITYDSLFASVKFLDTLVFNIQRTSENGFGNNNFRIALDSDLEIDELNEGNNFASLDFFMPLFGTRNLFPVNYGIVNQQPVELLAQSSNLLEGQRNFLFEIDTTSTFNSPFLKMNSINSKLLASWSLDLLPDISSNDSLVYYWRTKFANPNPGENDEWVQSSFTYIQNGQEGWSQSEFDQFTENTVVGFSIDSQNAELEYLRTPRSLELTTFGSDNPATNADVSVRIDGIEYIIDNQKRCRDNTLNLIAFDKVDAVPYAAVPLIFQDSRTCGRQPQVINSFRFSELETGSEDLIDYFNNVAEGDSVALFTIGDPQQQSWSANVIASLEGMGISSATVSSLQNGEPFIAFGRKGDVAGSATEITATNTPVTEQQLQGSLFFTGVQSEGTIRTSLIGPADSWGMLSAKANEESSDQIGFNVFGINLQGVETLLLNNISTFPVDLSAIVQPFIRLEFLTSDNLNLTPAQLDEWFITYTPVAEGILIAESPSVDQATFQEGELVQKTFQFKNIGSQSFNDSILVEQQVFNNTARVSTTSSFNISPPELGDTTTFNIEISTFGKSGSNNLKISVNPRSQPEIYYDNNILDLVDNIVVESDQINPLLDVLFDGRYIINGDIVSPSPLISVRLKDENPFIKVNDTTAMNIFIKKECEECVFERLSYSDPEISWVAASDDEDFKVEYKSRGFEDGVYTLRIEASDESGNSSGQEPYLISFEVINESSITNFYPYPNPFSTNTRFVFTLTGSVIPDEIIIRIMTVTGKVVREITQREIGSIFIGNNISDYSWDGKDEFGDQLANGVYLYRVYVKQGGTTLKHRNTSADKAFKNGFGKLYILR